MGMSTDELGYTVDALVDGAYATDYYIGGDKIDLTIIGQRAVRRAHAGPAQPADRHALRRPGPPGRRWPTSICAGGPEQINRRERQRAITIPVTPPPDDAPGSRPSTTIDDKIVQPLRGRGEIGGEYQIHLAGTADKLRATWKALRWNFLLALLITYLLMAALFESWLYPFVIILSVPLGAVGGLLGLWLLEPSTWRLLGPTPTLQTLDVLTMLGFVILIGTVVNNAILIVHQSLNHMRDEGMTPNEAILASVRTRIRPDLHDHLDHRAGPLAAGLLPRGRQRALPRPGRRRAGRAARLDRLHPGAGAHALQPDDAGQGRAGSVVRVVGGDIHRRNAHRNGRGPRRRAVITPACMPGRISPNVCRISPSVVRSVLAPAFMPG